MPDEPTSFDVTGSKTVPNASTSCAVNMPPTTLTVQAPGLDPDLKASGPANAIAAQTIRHPSFRQTTLFTSQETLTTETNEDGDQQWTIATDTNSDRIAVFRCAPQRQVEAESDAATCGGSDVEELDVTDFNPSTPLVFCDKPDRSGWSISKGSERNATRAMYAAAAST